MADTSQAPQSPGTGFRLPNFLQVIDLFRQTDIQLAVGVMSILVVLILPMPPFMLDILLAVSIVFSVLVLMTSLFIQAPLEFSAFPTVLLITTMLRLSLNLASTRLILAEGHNGTQAAGNVIEAFGNFVMRGNFVIGIIVFAILVIVNFVVITKGSGRIAEVAARFTLDAMPGKQMAIDADLSAGLIDEAEARSRRKALEDESSFFGAMDGASKFVRGDAIAGLLITFINIIGGMIIGVAQMGLTFMEAGNNYTLLTVGDGLVSQIPALIVSTAAGPAGVQGRRDRQRRQGACRTVHRLSARPRHVLGGHGHHGLPARHACHPLPRPVRRRRLCGLSCKPHKKGCGGGKGTRRRHRRADACRRHPGAAGTG